MKNIHIVFGSQGAGKSTYSKKLAEKEKGIHLSIDDWMSELFGPDLPQPMNINWIMERVKRCEKMIWLTTIANSWVWWSGNIRSWFYEN